MLKISRDGNLLPSCHNIFQYEISASRVDDCEKHHLLARDMQKESVWRQFKEKYCHVVIFDEYAGKASNLFAAYLAYLKTESVLSSQTSIHLYQAIRRHIP
jgi:hypothetical protein